MKLLPALVLVVGISGCAMAPPEAGETSTPESFLIPVEILLHNNGTKDLGADTTIVRDNTTEVFRRVTQIAPRDRWSASHVLTEVGWYNITVVWHADLETTLPTGTADGITISLSSGFYATCNGLTTYANFTAYYYRDGQGPLANQGLRASGGAEFCGGYR